MGTIIQFPDAGRTVKGSAQWASAEGATVIILPAIRIERHPSSPTDGIDPNASNPRPRPGSRRGSR